MALSAHAGSSVNASGVRSSSSQQQQQCVLPVSRRPAAPPLLSSAGGRAFQRQACQLHAAGINQQHQQPCRQSVVAAAGRGAVGGEKWWEKETPNMKSISSVQELVDELADAGDNLVIVDFYAPWCGACRALYPKLLKLMDQFPDIVFLKVDFDNNKAMCKTLGVKVLPFFHVYHGAEGRVAAFSCTVSKFQRMRDALEEFYTPICSLEDNPGLPEFPEIIPHPSEVTRVAGAHLAVAEERLATQPAAAAAAAATEQQQQQREPVAA